MSAPSGLVPPRLFVRRAGRSGPLVVLLHGLGASGRYWRLVARRLAAGARVLCPDLLGFGRSPRPPAGYTAAEHLAALEATLDSLGLGDERVVLGGHSTGAILALEWAATQPDRLRGVMLAGLPVYRSAADARARIARLSPLAWATVEHPALGKAVCEVMCAARPLWRAVMPLVNPGVPADIARDFVLHDWPSYSGTLEHVVITNRIAPAAERLAAAGTPIRILHGARDRTAPPAAVRALAERCGWPLVMLEGDGHELPLSAPDRCAEMLWSLATDAMHVRTDEGVAQSMDPDPTR